MTEGTVKDGSAICVVTVAVVVCRSALAVVANSTELAAPLDTVSC